MTEEDKSGRLDKLPRELLLILFTQFLDPSECFCLRYLCRDIAPLASRGFEIHIRRMIESLDLDLISVIRTLREKGYFSNHKTLGSLFRKCGGSLNHTVVFQFIVDNYSSVYADAASYGRFLKGLVDQPTAPLLRFLFERGGIARHPRKAQIMRDTSFDTQKWVDVVLAYRSLSVQDKIVLLADLERWPRTELTATQLSRVFGLVRGLDRATADNILRQTLVSLLDTPAGRYRAVLAHPDGWSRRGSLLMAMVLNNGGVALDAALIARVLTATLLPSNGVQVVEVPQSTQDRRTFIRGFESGAASFQGPAYYQPNSFSTVDKILQVLLSDFYWSDEHPVQAWDCIPPDFLTPLTLKPLFLERIDPAANLYHQVPINIKRFAKLIRKVSVQPIKLFLDTLLLDDMVMSGKPVPNFSRLLAELSNQQQTSGFDGAQWVAAVGHSNLPVETKITIIADFESWPRTELGSAQLSRVFDFVKCFRRPEVNAILCRVFGMLLDSPKARWKACLAHPDGWEARGQLLMSMLLHSDAEVIAEALAATLLPSTNNSSEMMAEPRNDANRVAFIRGFAGHAGAGSGVGRKVLQALLTEEYWPDECQVQAWHCVPQELLTPEVLKFLLSWRKSSRGFDSQEYPISLQRLARVVQHVSAHAAKLLLETLQLDGLVVGHQPIANFTALLSHLDTATMSLIAYATTSWTPHVQVVSKDNVPVSRFCEMLCRCLADGSLGSEDSFEGRFEVCSEVARDWYSSLGSYWKKTPAGWELAEAVLRGLCEAVETVRNMKDLEHNLMRETGTTMRFYGLLCGLPAVVILGVGTSPLFSHAVLGEAWARNNHALFDLFVTYQDLGEFLTGYLLALNFETREDIEEDLSVTWKFDSPDYLQEVDISEVVDAEMRRKLLQTLRPGSKESVEVTLEDG